MMCQPEELVAEYQRFSPYQLVTSNNPQQTNSRPTSEVIWENLELINKAKKAFAATENPTRI